MCNPALIIMGAAATVGAYGAYQGAKANKQSLEYGAAVDALNAQARDRQADDILVRGMFDMHSVTRAGRSVAAKQQAAFASSGVDLREGTPLAILEDTSYFSALDAATVRSNSEKEAWAARVGAEASRTEGRMKRATADAINPLSSALTAGLSGGAQVAGSWYTMRGGARAPASSTPSPYV